MQAKREIGIEELVSAYQEWGSSPAGKIVINHLVAKFGFINKSTNVPGDPYGTHVNEGHRGVMVFIGRMMSLQPEDLKKDATADTTGDEGKHDDEF